MIHFTYEVNIVNNKDFLVENFFLFKNVKDNNIEKMLNFDGISLEEYKTGDLLQGSKSAEKIGIILNGKAIIKSDDDGVIIRKLTRADVYGAACLFDRASYLTIVVATTDCSIITFNKAFIEKCILFDKTVSFNYIEFLAKRISFLNSKINSFTAKSAENKLYAYLLQLPREKNVIDLKIDMSTIAKMIGIGRATLYRAMDKLQSNGTITKIDKKIILNEV